MKKLIFILILVCAMPSCATAQWYLFPGRKKSTTPKEEPVEVKHDTARTEATGNEGNAAIFHIDTVYNAPTIEEDVFTFDIPDVVDLTLALPLQADGARPSDNFLEMYAGALVALRDLGEGGMKIRLDLRDTGKSAFDWSEMPFGDVTIGPISTGDLSTALAFRPEGRPLVSPLDPKAAEMVDTCALIQAPVHWKSQIDDMIAWVKSDTRMLDEIIVLKDTLDAGIGEQASYIFDRLSEEGMKYRTMYSISGMTFSEQTKYRFIIASDRDLYITSAVRDLGIAGSLNEGVSLYATSRVRSCISADITDLYNAKTRLSTGYYIDYESPDVEKFILTFRSLFGSEPGSFAFQGYDTVHYFATICSKYGRQWYKKLPDYSERGLQSDYRFKEKKGVGQINSGVRRVVFDPNLSSALQ